jgi:hypothetical protein
VCIESSEYPASLESHKIYRVLADKDAAAEGDLRIVDESGEDYLYPAEWVAAIDPPRQLRTSLLRGSARPFSPHNLGIQPTAFGRGLPGGG